MRGPRADARRRWARAAPARTALALIRVYQLFFSPLFAGSCRFVPSCSAYAAEAVERHGAARGLWLAVRRIARCHPLCRGGLDPVPEARAARRPAPFASDR
ncbi:MAG: membrane protein insertion efficiency factor YidD [Acidobacteria bacterium]|nr:membrane protein insertion efficiency factor YidD [Acidobacteriota bacterium]